MEKLSHMRLEVIQTKIKNKSGLPTREYTITKSVHMKCYSSVYQDNEGGEGGLNNILGEIVREGGLMKDYGTEV